MKDLEARKKLLVAESEVYRQTLRLDVQNLRLYTIHMQRKFATYAALKPALMVAVPLVSSMFSRRSQEKERPRSLFSTVMSVWRMYKGLQPLITSLMAQYGINLTFDAQRPEPVSSEDETPAAAI